MLGGFLGLLVAAYRAIRDFRTRQRRRVENAYTDFRNRHAVTAPNLTRKNTRRAYERVYGSDRLLDEYLAPERVAFYGEVAELAVRLRPASVIDVGCGPGLLLRELAVRVAPGRLVGIDHASAGIRRAQGLVPSGEFHIASLYNVPIEETFDLVCCTEVLEHLSDPDTAVERLVGLCAVGGAVVISVPDGAVDTWEGHLNFWTEPELATFLARFGDVEITRLAGDLLAVLRPRAIPGR